MSKTCPLCGSEIEDNATKCPYCGTLFTNEPKTSKYSPQQENNADNLQSATSVNEAQPTQNENQEQNADPDAYKKYLPAYKRALIFDFIKHAAAFLMEIFFLALPFFYISFPTFRGNFSWISLMSSIMKSAGNSIPKELNIILYVLIGLLALSFGILIFKIVKAILNFKNSDKAVLAIYTGCKINPKVFKNNFQLAISCFFEVILMIIITRLDFDIDFKINAMFALPCIFGAICATFDIMAYVLRRKTKNEIISETTKN